MLHFVFKLFHYAILVKKDEEKERRDSVGY